MRFTLSYSGGKDSTLALHKMIEAGHSPGYLLTMVNRSQRRSWFHGVDEKTLSAYERALGIPMLALPAAGDEYVAIFEDALIMAKSRGMEVCVFGDIDHEQNRLWGEKRCANAGMKAIFPLWNRPRVDVVREQLALGYKCVIKAIGTDKFPLASQGEIENLCQTYLGQILDHSFLRQLESMGADMCGENGEYHTLVVDGPVFRHPIRYKAGRILQQPGHVVREIDFI